MGAQCTIISIPTLYVCVYTKGNERSTHVRVRQGSGCCCGAGSSCILYGRIWIPCNVSTARVHLRFILGFAILFAIHAYVICIAMYKQTLTHTHIASTIMSYYTPKNAYLAGKVLKLMLLRL